MSPSETTIPTAAVYARAPDIVPRQIAGDTILVAVRGELARLERLHVLNTVGEHIWGLLDGRRTVAGLSIDVTETFDIDAATALEDVAEFLADLEDAGLATVISPGT
ncbi:MAG: PqqD family protein [Acidobacteriota bacterium]|nr:PqqD family protein [Acidobacteriota bacterium]